MFNQNFLIMKRLVLFAIILVAACTVAMAQPRAIGGRVSYGIGASYQHGFGEKNMLQADLDFFAYSYSIRIPGMGRISTYDWGVQATATYNWIFPISSWTHAGSWNWYAGVGGGIGWNWYKIGWAGVAGMIGVEYNFKFPLQLSIDWRPIIGPMFGKNYVEFNERGLYQGGAFGLGVRYEF